MGRMNYIELYKLQDIVIKLIREAKTGFYLSGGTAASRGYLNHRYSDDLDFFVNDSNEFLLWGNRIIEAIDNDFNYCIQI